MSKSSKHNEETEDLNDLEAVEASEETVSDESADNLKTEETRSTFGNESPKMKAAAASGSGGMSSLAKGLVVIGIIFAIGAGLVFWKTKYGHYGAGGDLNKISAQEMEILLKDANPMMLKRLAEDPEMKKQQADNLRQLLAVASQARKEGIDQEPAIKAELENMRAEILAVNYDQFINKDKGPMPAFGFIGEDRVKEFWSDASHEAEFKKFLDAKLQLMKENNPAMDRQPTEEELAQAKEYFAKIKIYQKEAEQKLASGELGEDFKTKVDLQAKLQQAQLLARTYAQKVLSKKTEVTDADVDKYIAEHPELNPEEKKKQAEEILKRAKAGEDFAKLADEFSQDPGNKTPDGKSNGGLYADVPKGRMMPEFEAAALALEPGQVADNLVETPYGYHIIKLEKKEEVKDQNGQTSPVYDVRHILITTTVKDSENPMGREMPVKDMVRAKLETEKQKQVLDEIVKNNPVEVAMDYKVPEVSDEEMQKMMQQQMQQQMPQGAQPPPDVKQEAPKPDAKPAPKK